jgi:hypothetical protein
MSVYSASIRSERSTKNLLAQLLDAIIGAVTPMRLGDYSQSGKKWRFRLHEKGGKLHELPAYHNAKEYLFRAGLMIFTSIAESRATRARIG